MFSTCKIFDSITDAKLYHLTEQMVSDVILVPQYDVLYDRIYFDGRTEIKTNGKIQYSHKRHFIKYQPVIEPVLVIDETDKAVLIFVVENGKLSITYKDITTSPSTYRYFYPTNVALNEINNIIKQQK